ncbi:MAG: hypothetical protein H6556_02790 [Lewinellaceae bacterium]|nr:hypothetical protein [Lewinellaceae bacterium]
MHQLNFYRLILMISLSWLAIPAQAQSLVITTQPQTPEQVVRELYDLVTFPAGTTPDWDKVKSLFIPEAVIVLRTSREATTVFSVDGFVADFVRFIEQAKVEQTGFTEKIIRMEPMVFGDMAQFLVLYEASIPGRDFPPQQGVDNFSLIKKDGQWKIAAITNEVPAEGRPLPEVLRE